MSTINLLPDDYLRRIVRRRMNFVFTILFGVTLAAVVSAALASEQSTRHTREVRQTVEAAYGQAAQQLRQLQQLEGRKQKMIARAESISALLEKVPRSHLLAVIANCLPENASLVRMDLDTRRVIAPAAPPSEAKASKFDAMSGKAAPRVLPPVVAVELVGLAGTDVEVARFIARLARNPLIATVDLAFSQEKIVPVIEQGKTVAKTPVREFQIHLELKPDADAIQDMADPLSVAEVLEAADAKGVER